MRAKFIHPTSHLRRDYDAGGEYGLSLYQLWWNIDPAPHSTTLVWGPWRRRWYRVCRWVVSLG